MQQRKDTSTKEVQPLTPPGAGLAGARPPQGHNDGSDSTLVRRNPARVGPKKKKYNEKEQNNDENI